MFGRFEWGFKNVVLIVRVKGMVGDAPKAVRILLGDVSMFRRGGTGVGISGCLAVRSNGDLCVLTSVRGMSTIRSGSTSAVGCAISYSPVKYCSRASRKVSFERNKIGLPSPARPICLPSSGVVGTVFDDGSGFSFRVKGLSGGSAMGCFISKGGFFNGRVTIINSANSNGSYTMSQLLRGVVGVSSKRGKGTGSLGGSRVVVFSVRSRCRSTFGLGSRRRFGMGYLSIRGLYLPC